MTAVQQPDGFTDNFKSIEKACLAMWEPVYRFIYFKVQNREEAEDITQEAYIRAFTYFQEHKDVPDYLLGFMKTTALNILRDRWRKNQRRGIRINFEEIVPELTNDIDELQSVTEQMHIESALAQLSSDQRTVIDLRIIKGYSAAETARMMGKTEAAVRTAQYRAIQALARILKN